jgi:hypothetical protein
VFALALAPLTAGAVDIEPSITLAEIYTSNVNLAPDGQEEDEWVTRVAPAVSALYKGSAMRLDLNYVLEALVYANDSDRNEVLNQLDADALFDLVGDDLQLRTRGAVYQVNVTPDKPVTSNNINVTGNRADAVSWDVGPQWRRKVLGNSELDGEFLVGHVNFDDEPRTDDTIGTVTTEIQDVDTMDGRVSLHTLPESDVAVTYDLTYDYSEVDYQASGEASQAFAYLQLGYRLRPEFEVFALGGLDSDFEEFDDASLSEGRWEVGVASGTASSRFEAAVGHRYFGGTWRLNWLRERNDVTYNVRYSESPTTTDLTEIREISTTLPGDDPGELPPDPGIGRPGSPVRYIEKRGDAGISLKRVQSTTTFDLFWERREDQRPTVPNDFGVTTLEDEKSWGAIFDLAVLVGSRSQFGVGASWRKREFIRASGTQLFDDEDDLTELRLRFEHELGLRTSVGLQTGVALSDGATGSATDYDEYWAVASLLRKF